MQKQKQLYSIKHQRETVQKQQKQVAAMNTCNFFFFFYTATPGVFFPPVITAYILGTNLLRTA